MLMMTPIAGRYIPSPTLRYVYPDEYEAADIKSIGNDSNILVAREHTTSRESAVTHKHLLVDVG